jgi:homoserine dehydrogenase
LNLLEYHSSLRYPFDHAFATALQGSDNIISFTTKRLVSSDRTIPVPSAELSLKHYTFTCRYSPRPLIIQGSGAGADVTAMGVTVSRL